MSTRRLPAEERRKQILMAAIRVFARLGFHGATTREIAREAQVAEALIYRHFAGKQALFAAAVEFTAGRLVDQLDAIIRKNEAQPGVAIAESLEFFRALLDRNPDLAKMTFLVSAELDDPDIRNAYLPHQERALRVIQNAVRAWRSSGVMRPRVPSRAAAWIVLGSFQVLALMKNSGQLGELDIRPALDLVNAFLVPQNEDDSREQRQSGDESPSGATSSASASDSDTSR